LCGRNLSRATLARILRLKIQVGGAAFGFAWRGLPAPGLSNGIEAGRILTREMASVPLILFTMHGVDLVRQSALEAGFKATISTI
jgi:hypothetical protein